MDNQHLIMPLMIKLCYEKVVAFFLHVKVT